MVVVDLLRPNSRIKESDGRVGAKTEWIFDNEYNLERKRKTTRIIWELYTIGGL